jgi:hypothetical protein
MIAHIHGHLQTGQGHLRNQRTPLGLL